MLPSSPASRALVPLTQGAPKPLTIELLQKAGEKQGSVKLNARALAGPASERAEIKLERNREILTGLRAVLGSEYGRSTAALRPLLATRQVEEDTLHFVRALSELSTEELGALPAEDLAKTFTSVAKMVNSYETVARNFANQHMSRTQRDRALTAPADIHKCAYGLMNIAMSEAVDDDALSQHRLDPRDQAGPEPVFKPAFRAKCMEKFRAAMDTALVAHQGRLTPAQIDTVVNGVIGQIKKENPPPAKLPAMEAWEGVHEDMESKHRASVTTAWGPAPASRSAASSASSSSTASAASSPEGEAPMSEAQKARRKTLGLD